MKYYTFVGILKKAEVEATDSKIATLMKLEKNKVEVPVLCFVRDNWDTEQHLLKSSFSIFEKIAPKYKEQTEPVIDDSPPKPPVIDLDLFTDPCTAPIERTPRGNMKIFKDIPFPVCNSCEGRMFKNFKFCPWCGEENTPVGDHKIFYVPIKFKAKVKKDNIIIDDLELGKVTEADVLNGMKTIEKHIPRK